MKTKNIIMILAALPLVAGLTGCKSDDELSAKPANETLIVEGGDVTFSSSEDKKYVDISADCSWHVVDFQVTDDSGIIDETKSQRGDFGQKLMVEPMRGSGNSTIAISIDKNGGTLKRGNAYIILQSDGGLRQRINITQQSNDPGMSIAGTTDGGLNFADAGGVKTLTIESNTSWTIETLATDWITLSKTSGSGNDYVTVTVPAETTGKGRDATLIFKYSNKVASVMIRQGGKTDISLSVDKENLIFAPAEIIPDIPDNEHEREHFQHMMEDQGSWEGQTVKVTSNASWRVSIPAGESWLKVDRDGGVGNGEFVVRCSGWTTSTQRRMSVVMVVAGTQTNYVFINQSVEGYAEDKLEVLTLYSMSVYSEYANFRFDFVYGEQGSNEMAGQYGVVYSPTNHTPDMRDSVVVAGSGKTSGGVGVEVKGLKPRTTYYVRGFVYGSNGVKYSPNVVTITTSDDKTIPGESDNPDPQLSRRRF